MFEEFINKAKKLIEEDYNKSNKKRTIVKKLLPDETRENETRLDNGKDNLRINIYFVILDRIRAELEKRPKKL